MPRKQLDGWVGRTEFDESCLWVSENFCRHVFGGGKYEEQNQSDSIQENEWMRERIRILSAGLGALPWNDLLGCSFPLQLADRFVSLYSSDVVRNKWRMSDRMSVHVRVSTALCTSQLCNRHGLGAHVSFKSMY